MRPNRLVWALAITALGLPHPTQAQSSGGEEGTVPISWVTRHVGVAACTSCHTSSQDEAFRTFQANHSWVDVDRPVGSDHLGADLIPVDLSLSTQLHLPEGQGLVVSGVASPGQAEACGLKANDILLTLAEKPLHAPHDVLTQLKAASVRPGHADDPVPLKLLREGKPLTIQVKPEVRVTLGAVKEESAEYYLGTPANVVDETLRSHLSIPEGTGLILGEIAKDSPAAKAGLQPNDILLKFDSKPVPDVDSLRAAIQATKGKEARLEILRAGKSMTLTATPELRKNDGASEGLFEPIPDLDRLNRVQPQLYQFRSKLHGSNVESPIRFYSTTPNTIRGLTVNPAIPNEAAELNKKIEELNRQISELTRAVEALSKNQGSK